ncbi:hypothetical protein [Streptomyces smyrnaeus]|uniref:hypothetical protein n=1 Tax=Streptomyces smyrnaeus TaxID=1387713 RepID=UPI003F4D2D36
MTISTPHPSNFGGTKMTIIDQWHSDPALQCVDDLADPPGRQPEAAGSTSVQFLGKC